MSIRRLANGRRNPAEKPVGRETVGYEDRGRIKRSRLNGFHSTTDDALIGKQIGGYRILEKIGEGAMGAVYRGHNEISNRGAAIKVISDNRAEDERVRGGFIREVRVATRIKHPNIVEVFDGGLDELSGRLYLIMEELQGTSLESVMREGPLSFEQAKPLLLQICDALEAIHNQGTIHRDLKPSNVMLTETDEDNPIVKLLDFGLAKPFVGAEKEQMRITDDGQTRGSPAYISPEQAGAKDLDQRSDIYSLGVVMYEMLTGHVPFEDEVENTVQMQVRKITKDVTPPSKAYPSIGMASEVEAIMMRALERDPEKRFACISEMADAIRKCTPKKKLTRQEKAEEHWRRALARIEVLHSPGWQLEFEFIRTERKENRIGTPELFDRDTLGEKIIDLIEKGYLERRLWRNIVHRWTLGPAFAVSVPACGLPAIFGAAHVVDKWIHSPFLAVPILLLSIPLGLVVGGSFAYYIYFKRIENKALEEFKGWLSDDIHARPADVNLRQYGDTIVVFSPNNPSEENRKAVADFLQALTPQMRNAVGRIEEVPALKYEGCAHSYRKPPCMQLKRIGPDLASSSTPYHEAAHLWHQTMPRSERKRFDAEWKKITGCKGSERLEDVATLTASVYADLPVIKLKCIVDKHEQEVRALKLQLLKDFWFISTAQFDAITK